MNALVNRVNGYELFRRPTGMTVSCHSLEEPTITHGKSPTFAFNGAGPLCHRTRTALWPVIWER